HSEPTASKQVSSPSSHTHSQFTAACDSSYTLAPPRFAQREAVAPLSMPQPTRRIPCIQGSSLEGLGIERPAPGFPLAEEGPLDCHACVGKHPVSWLYAIHENEIRSRWRAI